MVKDLDFKEANDIFTDVADRNDGKNFEDLNFVDKYNLIASSRVLCKELNNISELLGKFAKIPLECIRNDRIKQTEADKYFLDKYFKNGRGKYRY